jgi:signal recognition particle subunit SEC65
MDQMTNPEAQLLAQIDVIDDSSLKDIPTESRKPTIREASWQDWVLSHLVESEKDKENKYPTSDGLKRLVYLLLGDIVNSQSIVLESPNESNRFTAVVQHTIVVEMRDGSGQRTFTAVGESNDRNTDAIFNKYPCAIASSRSQGRCYRDALRIRTVTTEELSKVAGKDMDSEIDDDDLQPIETVQKKVIIKKCSDMKIDVMKLINLGQIKYSSIDGLTKGKSKAIITLINAYQGGKEIPDNIKIS